MQGQEYLSRRGVWGGLRGWMGGIKAWISLALPQELLMIMCGAGGSSWSDRWHFRCVSIVREQRSFKSENVERGVTLQDQLCSKILFWEHVLCPRNVQDRNEGEFRFLCSCCWVRGLSESPSGHLGLGELGWSWHHHTLTRALSASLRALPPSAPPQGANSHICLTTSLELS